MTADRRAELLKIFISVLNQMQKNTITVQNKDDYPLNLFLIKQGDQAAKVEVHLVGTKEKEHFGEEQDPDFTKGIRIRANFTDADTPLFYYKGSGSETSLNQSQLEKNISD